ncbi:hypothetical protein B0T25DRAFT_309581 [Lasiosphaeria hispida]|uniref:Uncharacterized protein n=1 Tax=Lasiosphaeria hispida TaxID=260671 RepID=A0AAJ0H8U3_9PEZI|nr:hypothetical protein B0T25DRAFT_309581 [Lasiosphaeria hispida]
MRISIIRRAARSCKSSPATNKTKCLLHLCSAIGHHHHPAPLTTRKITSPKPYPFCLLPPRRFPLFATSLKTSRMLRPIVFPIVFPLLVQDHLYLCFSFCFSFCGSCKMVAEMGTLVVVGFLVHCLFSLLVDPCTRVMCWHCLANHQQTYCS